MKIFNQLALYVLIFLSLSCNNNSKQTQSNVMEETLRNTPMEHRNSCYLYAVDKDTISLQFTTTKDSIEGNMRYKFHQIDGSMGAFNGTIKGDTIIGIYAFEAEGTKSKRELIFLKTKAGIVQGSGETSIQENTERFKKNTKFDFKDGRTLKTVDCN